MSWINEYLDRAVYVDGGRGPIEYDCWGLVREARGQHLGLSWLPVYGHLRNDNPRGFTKAYRAESAKLKECEPCHGAIAAVMIGNTCAHVALVVEEGNQLWILEINAEKGARKVRLNAWLRDHVRVTFHND
jgi:hypothetical protein